MALIGNYSVLTKDPGRSFGGSTISDNRANWVKSSPSRNKYFGSGSFLYISAVPNGYSPPYSWVIAQKGGGIAAYTTIYGSSSLTYVNLAGGLNAEAPLSGSGDLLAALGLIVSGLSNMSGSGDLTADIFSVLQASTNLSGSGDISSAALGALASLIAPLIGSGSLSPTLTGPSFMSSDIVVTGDVLNTANVASAVWNALAEGTFTYAQVVNILAAVAAGKTTVLTGSGNASIVFRDLNDTRNLISATMTGSNRTIIDIDV